MNQSTLPNYIPVKNEQDFNYDVIAYYNQYYASPYVTQQRRILRNYLSNQQTIKEFNRNPFINNKNKKYYFLYTYAQNYMIVENPNSKDLYILINKNWCKMRTFKNDINCNELVNFIKNNSLKLNDKL
jgi:hypothetical protein